MQQDILVNWSPQETRVALIEHGAVQELHVERTLERGLVGNVYIGKVSRVLPGMQSAFIDIGLERAAFLHVADVWHKPAEGETLSAARASQAQVPIERQVFEGQALMVQVIKDPMGTKGARLSTQISVAGRMLVFLPQDDHIGVSQKISLEQREALRRRVQELAGEAGGGFILRTNAEDASDSEIGDDIAYLRKAWARIKEAGQRLPVFVAGALVESVPGLAQAGHAPGGHAGEIAAVVVEALGRHPGQPAQLHQIVQIDHERAAREGRDALVRRVARAAGRQRQDLPHRLAGRGEPVHKVPRADAEVARAVRAGQAGDVQQNAAGAA